MKVVISKAVFKQVLDRALPVWRERAKTGNPSPPVVRGDVEPRRWVVAKQAGTQPQPASLRDANWHVSLSPAGPREHRSPRTGSVEVCGFLFTAKHVAQSGDHGPAHCFNELL